MKQHTVCGLINAVLQTSLLLGQRRRSSSATPMLENHDLSRTPRASSTKLLACEMLNIAWWSCTAISKPKVCSAIGDVSDGDGDAVVADRCSEAHPALDGVEGERQMARRAVQPLERNEDGLNVDPRMDQRHFGRDTLR